MARYLFVGYDNTGLVRMKSLPQFKSVKEAEKAAIKFINSPYAAPYMTGVSVIAEKARKYSKRRY